MVDLMIFHHLHERIRRQRVFKHRSNQLSDFSDAELISRYRLSGVGIELITLIQDDIQPQCSCCTAIDATTKVS